MNMNIYKYILGFSALLIAGSAAFFSVSGISQLYVGSFTAVTIMAGGLEFGKLVAASYLHRYWNETPFLLKTYLVIGVAVLMIITSMGIFGFLTSAYQETSSELTAEENKIETLETRKKTLEEELSSYTEQRDQLSDIRSQQTERLNTITSNDSLNANEIGYLTRQVQDRISEVDSELDNVSSNITETKDSLSSIQSRILELKSGSEARKELGPLLYVADQFDTNRDTAVMWFTLAIMFVFDPLAVSLVLAYNNIVMIEQQNKDNQNNDEKEQDNNKKNKNNTQIPVLTESDDIIRGKNIGRIYKNKNEPNSDSISEDKKGGRENNDRNGDENEEKFSFNVNFEYQENESDNKEKNENTEETNIESEDDNISDLKDEFKESKEESEGLTIDDLMETEETKNQDEDDDIDEILEEIEELDEKNIYGEPEKDDNEIKKSETENTDKSNEASKSTKRVDFHSGEKDIKKH